MVRMTAINESQSFIAFTHHGAVKPPATKGMLLWFILSPLNLMSGMLLTMLDCL